MTNIAVFASGTGSNAVNLVKAFNSGNRIHVALCLTDKENAPVIEKMKDLGVETIFFPRSVWKEEPQVILDILRSHDISVIALAGFLCFLSDEIVNAYEGKILNIHPSLLPAYGGKGMHGANVHKAVIEAGDLKSGATVHIVTSEIDAGPIVVQKEVAVLPDDTPESLEAKVHEVEYQAFPEAIMKIVASLTPPAIPKSVDDAWAEALGVPNNVPPIPKNDNINQTGPTSPTSLTGQTAPTGPTASISPTAPTSTTSMALTKEGMPPTYLVWSVIMTILCCTIPGIVAIINSAQVSSKFYQGDIEGASRASRNAEIWIIVSFVLGVISNTLYIPLALAGLF
ncbi:MAG: phosphoribosylglycinamide formyltransferase [Muribaculaceae bacterium]|nr:phosphoribosylglycinamide formyltransferase [Muribaculaceae bacterium]